jgi:cell division septal protein FtsQ
MTPPTRRRRSARAAGPVQRALRRSRWRTLLAWLEPRWLSIVIGSACFAGALFLLTSPQFRVEQVVIRRDPDADQVTAARAPQVSQVVGRNIFLVNTSRVAQDVASMPSVLRAQVVSHLPNVLEIQIAERVPIAVWRAQNGTFLVDERGNVLAEAPAAAVAREPEDQVMLLVKDTTGRDVTLGDRIDQHTLLAARELVRALPAAGAGVREVEYSPQGLIFTTDRQWRVIFGDTESLNAKLAAFKSIVELARSQNMNVGLVDLRPKDRPFYQLAGAS